MSEYFKRDKDGYIISKQFCGERTVYTAWTPKKESIHNGDWQACKRAVRDHKQKARKSVS